MNLANNIQEIEKHLKLNFNNKSLIQTAITHKSYVSVYPTMEPNERLEFFGDAVLKLIISEYLYNKYPDYSEGDLSKIRAQFVSDKNLASISKKLEIGKYLLLSNNETKTGGRTRASNLANAFEAILGAYYIDQGLAPVKDFLLGIIKKFDKNFSESNVVLDYKSRLQELIQQEKEDLPKYKIQKEEGPDHEKIFHISVITKLKDKRFEAQGYGKTKKQAEQEAAKNLLDLIS